MAAVAFRRAFRPVGDPRVMAAFTRALAHDGGGASVGEERPFRRPRCRTSTEMSHGVDEDETRGVENRVRGLWVRHPLTGSLKPFRASVRMRSRSARRKLHRAGSAPASFA